MADRRIIDTTVSTTTFAEAKSAEAKLLVDAPGWAEAKNILISLLGNSYLQGSDDGVTYSDSITTDSNYIKFSVDGGINYKILDFSKIPESTHNAVTLGTSNGLSLATQILSLALATTTSSGAMSAGDKIKIDKVTITGDGLTFLANDGTYKTLGDALPGDTQILFDDGSTLAGSENLVYNKTDVILTLLGKFISNNLHLVNELKLGTFTGTASYGMLKIEQVGVTGVYILRFYDGVEWQTIRTIANVGEIIAITLPAYEAVSSRCANAVEGTDYPLGWTLTTGDSSYDLLVTHNLSKKIDNVSVWAIEGSGSERLLVPFNSAYSGVISPSTNSVLVEGLTTTPLAIRIDITFI